MCRSVGRNRGFYRRGSQCVPARGGGGKGGKERARSREVKAGGGVREVLEVLWGVSRLVKFSLAALASGRSRASPLSSRERDPVLLPHFY